MKKIVFIGEYAFSKDDFEEIFDSYKKTYGIGEMTEEEYLRLKLSLISYLGGIRPPAFGLSDALLGIFDPVFGMYRTMLRRRMEEQTPPQEISKTGRIGIEDLYSKYPRVVGGYLEDVAKRLEEKGKGAIGNRDIVFRKMVLSLVDSISIKCPKCGERIPREVSKCPYCNEQVPNHAKEGEMEDPLRILKLRLAKGDVTKEEYEELKKVIERN